MRGTVLRLRNIAFGVLPVLVVVWATVAVLGGAIYLANHADPPDAGDAAKAGLGLCAVSVAVVAGRAVRRAAVPPFAAGFRPVPVPSRPQGWLPYGVVSGPPATGPPVFVLLQVFRK
jgi:hypothetical protein